MKQSSHTDKNGVFWIRACAECGSTLTGWYVDTPEDVYCATCKSRIWWMVQFGRAASGITKASETLRFLVKR